MYTIRFKIHLPIGDFHFWIGQWKTEASVPPTWDIKLGVDSVRYLLNGTLIEEVFTKDSGVNFQRGVFVLFKKRGATETYGLRC